VGVWASRFPISTEDAAALPAPRQPAIARLVPAHWPPSPGRATPWPFLMSDTIAPIQLRPRAKVDDATERLALRAALTAAHLFGLATGIHLRTLRGHRDPLLDLQGRLEEAELKARLASEVAEILAARFGKIPERKRPHYSPAQRFRILEVKSLLGWSAHQAAQAFLVCPNTIHNWEHAADPESRTVGSTVDPTPPVRRAADVVRAVAQAMTRLGLGGQDMASRILARAGWRVSARSVGRYRKERTLPLPTPDNDGPGRPLNPVHTRFVHHTWMMDVSQVRCFLGPDVFMAAVSDAHSRVPLMLGVFEAVPGAHQMADLLRCAARAFRAPKYLITDLVRAIAVIDGPLIALSDVHPSGRRLEGKRLSSVREGSLVGERSPGSQGAGPASLGSRFGSRPGIGLAGAVSSRRCDGSAWRLRR
jgi:hypothetical protein